MEWAGGPLDGAVQVVHPARSLRFERCVIDPVPRENYRPSRLPFVQCAAAHPSLPAVAIGTNQSLGHTSTAAPLLFTRVGSLEGLPYSSVLSLALADPSQAWVRHRRLFL
jgi:hypothetical protein